MSATSDRAIVPRPRCRRCGGVIGVYEPLVSTTTDGHRETSLAAEPDCCRPDQACYHSACYELITGGTRVVP